MDDKCIFCGAVPGLLNKKKLYCGNTTQILCKDCYPQYKNLSAVERAEAALSSGRAEGAMSCEAILRMFVRPGRGKTRAAKQIRKEDLPA